ncbi:hypothetical protein O181_081023 [Austropuccinia psidii MF-1]|uniref:Uncharacterized protein n=1 Tax=Austropuccinia psidii MF-1 TaxID=1389203 RepID=A0A9Q3FJS2_9BASI|nr:hypothetical protein [Austropuccinia psidii MF-1]
MFSKGFCLQSTVFLLALCANPFSSKPLIHCNIGYNAIANGYPSSDPNVPLPLVRCNFANKKATYDFDCQPDSCTGLILSQECKIDNRNPVEHGFSISRNELQSYKLASDPKYLGKLCRNCGSIDPSGRAFEPQGPTNKRYMSASRRYNYQLHKLQSIPEPEQKLSSYILKSSIGVEFFIAA